MIIEYNYENKFGHANNLAIRDKNVLEILLPIGKVTNTELSSFRSCHNLKHIDC